MHGFTMDSSSSDEEEYCQLPFWNNWLPPSNQELKQTSFIDQELTSRFVCSPLALSSISQFPKASEQGNWIPPVNFLNTSLTKKKVIQERNAQCKTLQSKMDRETVQVQSCQNQERNSEREKTPILERRDAIFDWEGRIQLHDVSKFNDGDLIWGIVNLGVFANIKLWINEYGNVCAQADGTISKLGSSEASFLSILDVELVRKMLGLSGAQWASLCESVQESRSTLIFDAFQDFRLTDAGALEKLWFFICKRRHLLPDQWMLVKLSGAVKCMRKFTITPKLVVQEIRNISEQEQTSFLRTVHFRS